MELILIMPRAKAEEEKRLAEVIEPVLKTYVPSQRIRTVSELHRELAEGRLRGKKLLFAAALGKDGISLELCAMLKEIRRADPMQKEGEWQRGCLLGSVGSVIVDAPTEFYTKSTGREIVRTANQAGCLFPGRPLAEGTGSLNNYRVIAQQLGSSLEDAYRYTVRELVHRLTRYQGQTLSGEEVLCIHACDPRTSNTYWAWKQIRKQLSVRIPVREISLWERTVMDCAGCAYEECMYYGHHEGCFYGGTMVEEVYPALEKCRILLLLCPNYNDALGANLTAFINRLTAPFRKKPFHDKALLAVVVSGYSGVDIVEAQLIDALNMNKSFLLPPNFSFSETANAAGSVAKNPGIDEKITRFSAYIEHCLNI